MNQQAWAGADLSRRINDRRYRGPIVDVSVCSGCRREALNYLWRQHGCWQHFLQWRYGRSRENPRAKAVAIKDGKFVAVGSDAEAMAFRGDATRIVGLQGRMVIWAASISPKGEGSDSGPVMVTLEYSINQTDAEQLKRAMQEGRAMRRRRGTLTWGLVQNAENHDNWFGVLY